MVINRHVGRGIAAAFLATGLAASPAFAQPNFGVFNDLLQRGMGAIEDRTQQRPAVPETPAITGDPQVARIQQRLLELGFDAGTPDGLMGNKTRQAIAGFQRQNGFAATGTLAPDELTMLMGNSGNVAVSPYLTMEPARIVAFQQALIARGLLSGGADGVVGNGTRRAVAAFQRSIGEEATGDLTESQLEILVAATSTAVAAPAQPAEAAPLTTETLDALPLYDHSGNPVRSARPFARQLALATLQLFPALLDSPAAIKRWFDAEHPFNTSTPSALRGEYERANAVERDRLLATFRDTLLEEARGVAVPSPGAPWRLAIVTRVNATGYRSGEGITLNTSSAYHLESKIVRLASDYLGFGLIGILPTMPDVTLVSTSGDDESSRLLDRIATEQAVVVTRLAISRIGADAGLGDVFVSNGRDIGLTVTLDGASLNTVREVADFNPVPGDVLKTLSGSASAANGLGGGADPLAAARTAGLAVVDGHVVLTPNTFYDIPEALAPGIDYKAAQQRFLDLAGYLASPPTRFSNDDLRYLAFYVLSQAERVQVFGDQFASGFSDEFERRAGVDILQRQIMPALLAREAATLPIPVVAVREMRLGAYDFDAQVFPLSDPMADSRIADLRGNFGPARFNTDYLRLPDQLTLPEAEARALIADRERFDRRIYLAAFGSLRLVGPRGDDPARLGLDATRVALFADQRLTRPLVEYAPADFVPPAEILPTPLTDAELRALAYQWMRAEKGTMPSQLAVLGEALSGTAGLVDVVIDSSRTVRSADEFGREAARSAVRQRLLDTAVTQDSLVTFPGSIELGEYDAATGSFPLRAFGVGPAANLDEEAFSVDFEVEAGNLADMTRIAVDAETARRMVAQGGRTLEIRAEGNLVAAATETIASRNATDIRFSLMIARLHVLVPPDRGDNLAFVESIEIDRPERAPITATLPEGRPVLTPDALMVKAFGPAAAELPDDALRALYVERFLYETEIGTWLPRFFAEGSRATRLQFDVDRTAFIGWLGATARAIPDDVTIIWRLGNPMGDVCGIFARTMHPTPAFAGVLDEAGQRAAISALTKSVLSGVPAAPAQAESVLLSAESTAASRSGGCWAYSADALAMEHRFSTDSARSMVVLLDRLPVYDPGWSLEWSTALEAEIDVHLDRLDLVDHSGGLAPHVRAFGQVAEVRYHDGVKRGFDGRPISGEPVYAASFAVTAAAEKVAEATTPAVPPAGGLSADDAILQGIQSGGADDAILSGLNDNPAIETIMLSPIEEIEIGDLVMSFALSSSGRLALVGAENYFALWDMQERKLVRRLLESGGFTRHISWAPDGRSALVLHDDGIRWWDLTTGTVKSSFEPAGPPTFLTNDTFLIGMSGTVAELRATDGSPVRKIADGNSFWPSIESGRLAVMNGLTSVDIVEITTGTIIRRLIDVNASGWVEEIAISADGTQAAIGSSTGAITLWDLGTGQRLAGMTGHTNAISGLAFRGDELVSAAGDGTMRFWRLSDGANVATAGEPNGATVGGPYVKPNSATVYTTGYAIKGWDFTGQ